MKKSETSHRQIRVLLVGPSLNILGGQAVQAKRLLDGLQESESVSASFLAVNPVLPGVLGSLQKIKYVRTLLTSSAYAWSLLRKVPKYDVIHAFSASYTSYLLAPLPAMIVAKCFGKATLLNYRSGEADDHLQRWSRTAVPTMRRFADTIVTPSGYLVEVFSRYGLTAKSIANFVQLQQWPYRRRVQVEPRFLSNRNLEPLYNVACTIRAFALVQQRFPHARLTIAGDGIERHQLEELVSSHGLNGVRFVGRVANSDMGALYNEADIYLNSPNIDNMPGSIVEAFACGLPVVSTDAGGISFVVEHEKNGLLVGIGDHDSLATQAIRLIERPRMALELADQARRDCERRYVWRAVRAEWECVYAALALSNQA